MRVVSSPLGICLVFESKEERVGIAKQLLSMPDEGRIYAIGDNRIPTDELAGELRLLKELFSVFPRKVNLVLLDEGKPN